MTDGSTKTMHLLLTALTAASFVFAPLSGLGGSTGDRQHRVCIKTIDADASSSCCPKMATKHTCCPGGSPSSPDPNGHPSDCSCCITICGEVVLGAIVWSAHSFIENIVDVAASATGAPDHPGWRDPILRPPIG